MDWMVELGSYLEILRFSNKTGLWQSTSRYGVSFILSTACPPAVEPTTPNPTTLNDMPPMCNTQKGGVVRSAMLGWLVANLSHTS